MTEIVIIRNRGGKKEAEVVLPFADYNDCLVCMAEAISFIQKRQNYLTNMKREGEKCNPVMDAPRH